MKTLRSITFTILVLSASGNVVCFDETDETLESQLQQKMTFACEADSLTGILETLEAKVSKANPGFVIKILGKDLAFDGITKNKQIREFKQEDVSIAEILTAILKQANPIKVMDPTDPDWCLVWIVCPDPEDAQRQIVLITTRSAARQRGDKLPEVFQETEK